MPADGVPAQLAGHAGLEHIGLAPRFSDADAEAGEFAVPIDGIGAVGLEGVDGALGEFGDTVCHGSNAVDVWRGSYPSGKRLANKFIQIAGGALRVLGDAGATLNTITQRFIMNMTSGVDAWRQFAHRHAIRVFLGEILHPPACEASDDPQMPKLKVAQKTSHPTNRRTGMNTGRFRQRRLCVGRALSALANDWHTPRKRPNLPHPCLWARSR